MTNQTESGESRQIQWDAILEELEASTRSLYTLDLESLSRHRAVLERRSRAVCAASAFCSEHLAALPEAQQAELRERLERARETGDLAAARLIALKQNAAAEWGSWNQIRRALETSVPPAPPVKVNCRG
ncbi:MAG: hypothetical protein ACRD9L_03995 [Bryobacteraceae bacterium]